MAVSAKTIPFDHEGLKASLRSARLRELGDVEVAENLNLGAAYSISPARAQDDVLQAIGSFRQRYNHTPTWFDWKHAQMLILGPLP